MPDDWPSTLDANTVYEINVLDGYGVFSSWVPGVGAAILVAISMLLTFIAGLIPSGIAARKDPVIALRTE